MTASISRSSTARSASTPISPRSRLARASFSAAERNRLPTWSARKGGLVRSIDDSPPYLVGHLNDHPELRPLLLLGQDVAFLGRGEAALRREAELIEAREFGRFVDASLDVVL